MTGGAWASLSTIRVRLIAALAAALLPVLVLGAVQTAVAFNREAALLRENLGSAAERSGRHPAGDLGPGLGGLPVRPAPGPGDRAHTRL